MGTVTGSVGTILYPSQVGCNHPAHAETVGLVFLSYSLRVPPPQDRTALRRRLARLRDRVHSGSFRTGQVAGPGANPGNLRAPGGPSPDRVRGLRTPRTDRRVRRGGLGLAPRHERTG